MSKERKSDALLNIVLSSDDDGPRTNLQPHEFVSKNKNNKHEKNLTTIYTQNAQGLWRRPRDADGNILVDNPPDLSKLEYLIDYMRQNDVGAWLIQETWEEGDEFDIDVNGYHIFRHNATRGESGRQHLFRGVAIILSPLFYDAWKAAGSPPPLTTDDDSVGRFIRMNFQFESFDTRGRRIKGKFLLMPPPNDITINWRPLWRGRKRPGDGVAASLLGGGNRCILGILGGR